MARRLLQRVARRSALARGLNHSQIAARSRLSRGTIITADDAYGHHRVSTTPYHPEGLYPERLVNAAAHETLMAFDAAAGRRPPFLRVLTFRHAAYP